MYVKQNVKKYIEISFVIRQNKSKSKYKNKVLQVKTKKGTKYLGPQSFA